MMTLNSGLMWMILGYDGSCPRSELRRGLFDASFPSLSAPRHRQGSTVVKGTGISGPSDDPHVTHRMVSEAPTYDTGTGPPAAEPLDHTVAFGEGMNLSNTDMSLPSWTFDEISDANTLIEISYDGFMQSINFDSNNMNYWDMGTF